jgi:ATP-dependent Clp protease protease subunit
MIEIKGVIGEDYTYVKWLASLKQEAGPTLEVNITSPGGYVDDGLAIFVDLVEAAAAGRRVITRAVGECASIASVIFMGGTERVVGCPIMIHNPWMEAAGDANKMEKKVKELRVAEKQLEEIYAERAGLPRERVSTLMDAETWIPPTEAVALGFATAVDEGVASKLNMIKQLKLNRMTVTRTVAERLRAFFDGKKKRDQAGGGDPAPKANEVTPVATEPAPKARLELEAADGTLLVIEREEGDPQVGDAASPDGTFQIDDTLTIVVAGGVITEIIDTAAIPGEEATEALLNEIDRLNAEVERLTKNAKTDEERQTLNAVRVAGGIEKLVEKAGIKSRYAPATRSSKVDTPAASSLRARIEEAKKKVSLVKK